MSTVCSPTVLWNNYSIPNLVYLDFLLPNGLTISLEFAREATLNEVRSKLWEEIRNYSMMFSKLKTMDHYLLVSVSQDAKLVEYYDYTKRLCDLKLFYTFFRVTEIQGNLQEKTFNSNLSKAIGLYINEIEKIKENEIVEFRLELFKSLKVNWDEKLKVNAKNDEYQEIESFLSCVYAQNIEIDPSLLDVNIMNALNRLRDFSFMGRLSNGSGGESAKIDVNVHVMETDQPEVTYHLAVSPNATPVDVVMDIIRAKLSSLKQSNEQINDIVNRYKYSYMLNVCGCDEILYGEKFKISSYKYVKKCMFEGTKPSFHLISMEKIKSKLPQLVEESKFFLSLIQKNISIQENQLKHLDQKRENVELSWNSNESFAVYLDNLTYLPLVKECEKIFLKLAIYHGQELRHQLESDKVSVDRLGKDSSIKLSQELLFDSRIKNLHRCARLCISVYCVSKRKREFFSIGWISLNLFDYKGYLISGKKKLYLWQATQNSFQNQCLSDVTGQNPEKDYIRLNIEFMRNRTSPNRTFIYPNRDQIITFINRSSNNSQDECIDVSYALENDNSLLESILSKDALAELTEQEKNVLWRRREDCLNYPHSLPKLLQSVKWSNQADVIEIYNLLFKWPDIKPIIALELLNSIYSDIEVRNFAVKSLDKHMKDEEVQQYTLQLVQSLKNEPYYENLLTRFLLRRAFKSQRIGFDLFWNLKSEMKNPRYKYRFGLILETYCRGIGSYQLQQLLRQIEVVEKLTILAQQIKSDCDIIAIKKNSFLMETLMKPDYMEILSNFINPVNRSHILGSINPSKCRILTSAKRPIYLTWKNNTDYSIHYQDTFELIFKHGDDLRQDMLTLQIIKLMDIIWKSEGLDLKMLVYDCASTGAKTGFIEVIKNSMTLFKIQMEGGMKGRYQIDTSQLLRWIVANNPDKLDRAIDYFTKSCAGFCVATFILGIGDRHPDNIMISRDGQLFHIDFGHFLGHFKKKYGIKRERVPFVLTEDFTKVITRGSANPMETSEFKEFKKLCETAYIIIRGYSHLIINLFTLMLSSDMPELQSIEDIMYLRKTLAIDETDEKALEFFRSQFNEAYRLSYTTKLDWMCHALNRKNLI